MAEKCPAQAPEYRIPPGGIVSIEHPCIVRDLDKALKSLGGEPQLRYALGHNFSHREDLVNDKAAVDLDSIVGVSLRPDDPLAKRLPSKALNTTNVLLRVTVPKRTGRKRKRGSDNVFAFSDEAGLEVAGGNLSAPDLLERLRDNVDAYTATPVGIIRTTHRFRNLPDIQMCSSDVSMMRNLQENILPATYESLKGFRIDLAPGGRENRLFPAPADFAARDQPPFRYEYKQVDTSGNDVLENGGAAYKSRGQDPLPNDAKEIPLSPPPDLRPLRPADTDKVSEVVSSLRKLLHDRPLISRRAAKNHLDSEFNDGHFREASPYVGYSFRSGPFRDILIRYGVDPRSDPKYRFYQILSFKQDEIPREPGKRSKRRRHAPRPLASRATRTSPSPSAPASSASRTSHIFDGRTAHPDGKTWQICDITDPVLHDALRTPAIRAQCDVHQWGWYYSGTLSKVRAVMRDQFQRLRAGQPVPELVYRSVCRAMPDRMTKEGVERAMAELERQGADAETKILARCVRYQGNMSGLVRKSKGLGANADGADDEGDAFLSNAGGESANPADEGLFDGMEEDDAGARLVIADEGGDDAEADTVPDYVPDETEVDEDADGSEGDIRRRRWGSADSDGDIHVTSREDGLVGNNGGRDHVDMYSE